MIYRFIIAFGFLLLFSACERFKNTKAELRIQNENNFDIDSVEVVSPSDTYQFGVVKANSRSVYYTFDEIYQYAYIRAVVNKREFILQPIDYVGETPLDPGKYSYLLEIDTIQNLYGAIELTLVKD